LEFFWFLLLAALGASASQLSSGANGFLSLLFGCMTLLCFYGTEMLSLSENDFRRKDFKLVEK
jgi:hypothetical protein